MVNEICHNNLVLNSTLDVLQSISDVSVMKVECGEIETKILLASTKNIYSHTEFVDFAEKISKQCPGLISSRLPYVTEHYNVMFGFLKIQGNITIVVYPDIEIYSWGINNDYIDATAVPLTKLTGKQGCLVNVIDLFSSIGKKLKMFFFRND